jgi:hypothetical protein
MKGMIMKMKLKLVTVLLFGLCGTTSCFAHYNPSTGRWLSRDPIGEKGGLNFYVNSANDQQNYWDTLGLSNQNAPPASVSSSTYLKYESDGEIYFNGHVGGYKYGGDASHERSSVEAWFWQWASEEYCPNGLCNSDAPNPSSFVRASVKNKSNCPLTVTCSCEVKWNGATSVPGKKSGGFTVTGFVLDQQFHRKRLPKLMNGNWISGGAGTEASSLSFLLQAGASKELYNGQINVAVTSDAPGAWFYASMDGNCSCSF